MAEVDLDRGVKTRFHPNGMQICTYIGDASGKGADPGRYFTETGQPVEPELARQAGYDVERDAREAAKLKRLADYKRQLDNEYREEEDTLAQFATNQSKYDVRHIGAGQYAIFDKASGKKLTRIGMTRADLEAFIGKPIVADAHDPTSGQEGTNGVAGSVGLSGLEGLDALIGKQVSAPVTATEQ